MLTQIKLQISLIVRKVKNKIKTMCDKITRVLNIDKSISFIIIQNMLQINYVSFSYLLSAGNKNS